MAIHEVKEMFAGQGLFRGMRPTHIEILRSCARPARFLAGEVVGKLGEPADRFLLVRSGRLRIELPSRVGPPNSLQLAGPGDAVGWSWIVPPFRWTFDCVAETPALAASIDAASLRSKLEQDPELGYELLRRLIGSWDFRLEAACLGLTVATLRIGRMQKRALFKRRDNDEDEKRA